MNTTQLSTLWLALTLGVLPITTWAEIDKGEDAPVLKADKKVAVNEKQADADLKAE